MTADMLTAYYSRGCDSAELFAPYEIAQTETFEALKAYQGNLLLVGISYDKRTKKHICVMEEMQKEQEQRIYGVFILF